VADQGDPYVLKLYVTGMTPRSRRAIQNLEDLCANELQGQYRMEVIDVLERPNLAEDERILATPLLIQRLPPPLRRLIGDLSDRERVLLGLDFRSSDDAPVAPAATPPPADDPEPREGDDA